MSGPARIHRLAPIGALAVLLLLGPLACGAPKETFASRASRRDAEFADLSTQTGMATPAYQHPLAPVSLTQPVQDAAQDPQAVASSSSR